MSLILEVLDHANGISLARDEDDKYHVGVGYLIGTDATRVAQEYIATFNLELARQQFTFYANRS